MANADSFRSLTPSGSRREALAWLGAGVSVLAVSVRAHPAQARAYPVTLTDAQWRARLTPDQYRTLRQGGTERPFSSPLDAEKRPGTFVCAGCGNALYSSRTKFESGTGWPSFWRPLQGAVVLGVDRRLGYPRTEVTCADCGGHLGHVFDDGPPPTGKRYCRDGNAMIFHP